MRAIGRDKRKKITQMLKEGPKSIREIQAALGTDPSQYLTEMRKAGKIERKFVWVLK
jgi:predicted transcriptional regulator